MFSQVNMAQFYGSAYRKQGISAYGILCLRQAYSKVSWEFWPVLLRMRTPMLLGILR